MEFIQTDLPGVIVIEPKIWKDERGYFYESYNRELFRDAGIDTDFVQDNQSFSHKGALRGLHGQSNPFAQGKLVRVIQGKVMDVAVDIRKGSPTYGKHIRVELSGENFKMLWIPAGFLHGFVTLEDNTIFTYKVDKLYNKESEIGVRWNDPDFSIDWTLKQSEVILSQKDAVLPLFRDFESPF
ncbi:dTDP-4-dehydrorhamnose 3,5-epimerase [Pararcticibacter amylolyticus]|uniref:dTDP-4-dehydrorhamnose 3,5-epimerase n=1 Tax=Pararcticibacter amylolyticus TaxID=2173175 RepID=A0A2U2PBU8_9SPHI|nr:dTDP-4-dehydrorhamnose 3,5-epimerase [Pararcticibacter amylolyticus]PWG78835.1 dTDP-4-dehydrorhamnose 3,5-epimerase [Pararcticibacter amylolyticus]